MIYKVTVRGISFRFSVSGQNPVARVDTPFVVILIGHPFPFAARCFLPFADQRKRTHMAMDNLIAEVHATINAPVDEVWDALVNPEMINRYMFGTTVESEWKEGSKIFWRGEWKAKSYRSTAPFRVVGEVTVWQGHPKEQVKTMLEHLEQLKKQGVESLNTP